MYLIKAGGAAGVAYSLLATGQITPYHSADDGDVGAGGAESYTVNTTGDQSATSNIDVAQYAAATISFTAGTKTIADGANGLTTILTGDIIIVHGSTSNDGTYTVAGGSVAGSFTVDEALTDEAAAAYITLLKRTTHSNNTVDDDNTELTWNRYTSDGEDVGSASNGTLEWYNAASVFILHPANNDLKIVAPDTLRIGGADESARFLAGTILKCAGFANAVNNDEGYRVTAVAFDGADTNITLDPVNATLVSEGPGINASIGIVCRSIFGYCAPAREVGLGGYTDWRVPNETELQSLKSMEPPSGVPDAIAFPGWPGGFVWTSTVVPAAAANRLRLYFPWGSLDIEPPATLTLCALVRGGL